MAEPFIGEIRATSFTFAPRGWAMCNGQLLPINQNQALFAILGTTYGGNGQTTFALPDLRGRVPMHVGADAAGSYPLGQRGGEAQHTLTVAEMPAHTHRLSACADVANASLPANALPAAKGRGGKDIYAAAGAPLVPMRANAVSATAQGSGHDNQQPMLVLNFIIALTGIFPSPN